VAKWPYNTPEWQKLRARKLAATPGCEYCPEGARRRATSVDHRIAIEAGGDPFPPLAGLASTCQQCHSQKTSRSHEAGAARTDKPRKGCSADGTPLDAGHWWRKQ